MKKIGIICLLMFLMTGCQSGFKGNVYQLENTNITLAFEDTESDQFYGKAVNNYFGTYNVGPNSEMNLSVIGTTMMMGPDNEMQAEIKYLTDLAMVRSYHVSGNQLILKLDSGEMLVFRKTGTFSDTQ